jgi:hypothetical protein
MRKASSRGGVVCLQTAEERSRLLKRQKSRAGAVTHVGQSCEAQISSMNLLDKDEHRHILVESNH